MVAVYPGTENRVLLLNNTTDYKRDSFKNFWIFEDRHRRAIAFFKSCYSTTQPETEKALPTFLSSSSLPLPPILITSRSHP